ncbi:hypothetical protein J6590_004494 [Homalodisca vitripennis]|nr:hypothetical protein J6590_004494 [Homalodisca vitripennis]
MQQNEVNPEPMRHVYQRVRLSGVQAQKDISNTGHLQMEGIISKSNSVKNLQKKASMELHICTSSPQRTTLRHLRVPNTRIVLDRQIHLHLLDVNLIDASGPHEPLLLGVDKDALSPLVVTCTKHSGNILRSGGSTDLSMAAERQVRYQSVTS